MPSHNEMYCPNCRTVAAPVIRNRGSLLVGLLLLLCFIVPGALYMLWAVSARKYSCPACHTDGVIPLDSPRAREEIGRRQTSQV